MSEAPVLDASMALSWCFSDEAGDASTAALGAVAEVGALVPAHWALEVANALLVGARRGRLANDAVGVGLRLLGDMPITVDQHTHLRALRDTARLAASFGLTTYDAAYLELVLRSGRALATLDERLAGAVVEAGGTVFHA